jgi:DNA-binding MarR family transcriptional regulator
MEGECRMSMPRGYLAVRVIQLANAVTWLRNKTTQSFGLTSSQSEVVRCILRKHDSGVTAGDIMEHLQLSQSTVAGILQRLEKKGLIERYTHADDNRINVIALTELGNRLRDALIETAIETERLMLQGMSAEEQEQFKRLLQIALDNINNLRQKETGDINE